MKSNGESKGVSRNIFNLVLAFFIFALIVFVFSLIYFEILGKTTGFASYGYVNLTINTQITLNVTNNTVNWGPGMVNAGLVNATLITHGGSIGTQTGGNWSGTNALALFVENIGNINCSLSIQAGKSAAGFLSGTGPEYQWNVSNAHANACGAWGELSSKGVFVDVNVSAAATVCNKLDFHTGKRGMYIDFRLVVPYDVNSTIANALIADTITISGNTAV